MAKIELANNHFAPEQEAAIDKYLNELLATLTPYMFSLTPQQRVEYGSIHEDNKLGVIKMLDYHEKQPHLDCPDVNYPEATADYHSRTYAATVISRLLELVTIMDNKRIAHDFDAINHLNKDYKYTKYKMEQDDGAGWEMKYKDLLPFFKTYYGDTTTQANKEALAIKEEAKVRAKADELNLQRNAETGEDA